MYAIIGYNPVLNGGLKLQRNPYVPDPKVMEIYQ